jgi:uncharacterized membrane protein
MTRPFICGVRDMAEVQKVCRILSFVGVGGLLLAVSYVYHRHVRDEPV